MSFLGATADTKSLATGPRFFGLNAASASSFTTSPGGCAISLLFKGMEMEWNNGGPSITTPIAHFTVVGSRAATGKRVTFDLRGSMLGASGSAAILIKANGGTQSLKPVEESYVVTGTVVLGGTLNGTLIEIALVLPKPDNNDKVELLPLDSIDISMRSCKSKHG